MKDELEIQENKFWKEFKENYEFDDRLFDQIMNKNGSELTKEMEDSQIFDKFELYDETIIDVKECLNQFKGLVDDYFKGIEQKEFDNLEDLKQVFLNAENGKTNEEKTEDYHSFLSDLAWTSRYQEKYSPLFLDETIKDKNFDDYVKEDRIEEKDLEIVKDFKKNYDEIKEKIGNIEERSRDRN